MDMTNTLHLWIVVLASGLAGIISHYLKKWGRNEIDGSLIDYLFRDHLRDSFMAFSAFLGVAASGVMGGQFNGLTVMQVALAAFMLGYGTDTLNKGSVPSSV